MWKGLTITRQLPTDVEALYSHFYKELYNAASRIILIDNLPEKADINFVMTHLLTVGTIACVKIEDEIYMTNGYLGGARDVNYYGTRVIGSNPILGSYDVERGVEGDVIFLTPFDNVPLDDCGLNRTDGGIHSLIKFTAALLADNISSINSAQINGRVQAIVTAEDSTVASTAEAALKELYAGKPYKVLTEDIYKRIHVNPISASVSSHQLIELIEVQQYIRAMFWNAIGIDANYNMKRERLINAEVEANFAALKVPVSTMLNSLNASAEKVNKCLNTEIHFRLNPEFVNLQQKGDENAKKNKSEESENTNKSDSSNVE